MSLNENSSREEILNCLGENPYIFLCKYSGKSWAQSYLDEAAKIAAKDYPTYFLINFLNKPWAQPYIDEAAKGAAKENPKYFLEVLADRFPHISFDTLCIGR